MSTTEDAKRPYTPIPTKYNGYRFRSRLEARWAVFFDALEIAFQYEPEGFLLPHSIKYLPDFYMPQVRLWAEVKPIDFTDAEKAKCKELVDATGAPCLLLVGPPDFRLYSAVHSTDLEGSAISQRYECAYLLDIDYHGRKHFKAGRLFSDPAGLFLEAADFSPRYREAVHLSRAHRFEEAA